MKKIYCVLTVIFCVFILAACNVNSGLPHTHDYTVVNHNENAHWLECECHEKAGVEFHKGGTATCTSAAVCSVCSAEYGETAPHDYTVNNKDEAQHWTECSCGEKKDVGDHSYTTLGFNETEHWYECSCGDKRSVEIHSGGMATETERAKCSVCASEYGEVKKATEGLVFVLNENQTGYEISGYYGTSEDVYIPSTYLGRPVTAIKEDAIPYPVAVMITSVTIPDSVVTIEGDVFAYAVKAVFYCEAKSRPAGWDEYWNYTELEMHSPVVWDCGNNNVADDGYTYGIRINGINYAVKDTEAKVVGTNIGGNATVPEAISYGGKTYTVTSIGRAAFAFDFTEIEDLADDFSLTGITLPDTIKTIEMAAFSYCGALTSVVIPEGVTTIAWGAFGACPSLSSIEIPDSVLSIGEYAFTECGLVSIRIPDGVVDIAGSAFVNCESLATITVGANNAKYSSMDGNLYSKDGKSLLIYAPGKTETAFIIPVNVTTIGAYAFCEYVSLKTVVIPSSVVTIEARAFDYCQSLTVYCKASSRPDGWSEDWMYGWGSKAHYWCDEWEFSPSGDPMAKESAYIGEYVLHHIERCPIGTDQVTTHNLGENYFGTVLSEDTIRAQIGNGTGNDSISYYFGETVYVTCTFLILDNNTAVAYLDREVDLFNNGNATNVFYFDIVTIDGQPCFILKATLGQTNYAYYVVRRSK